MEEVAQREITRLVAGPYATPIIFDDQRIEREKALMSPEDLLTEIRRAPLTFRDASGSYIIISAWLQDDGISVVVRARPI